MNKVYLTGLLILIINSFYSLPTLKDISISPQGTIAIVLKSSNLISIFNYQTKTWGNPFNNDHGNGFSKVSINKDNKILAVSMDGYLWVMLNYNFTTNSGTWSKYYGNVLDNVAGLLTNYLTAGPSGCYNYFSYSNPAQGQGNSNQICATGLTFKTPIEVDQYDTLYKINSSNQVMKSVSGSFVLVSSLPIPSSNADLMISLSNTVYAFDISTYIIYYLTDELSPTWQLYDCDDAYKLDSSVYGNDVLTSKFIMCLLIAKQYL